MLIDAVESGIDALKDVALFHVLGEWDDLKYSSETDFILLMDYIRTGKVVG